MLCDITYSHYTSTVCSTSTVHLNTVSVLLHLYNSHYTPKLYNQLKHSQVTTKAKVQLYDETNTERQSSSELPAANAE